jgi:hypothetical protein
MLCTALPSLADSATYRRSRKTHWWRNVDYELWDLGKSYKAYWYATRTHASHKMREHFSFAIAIFVFQLQCNCSACDVPPDAGLHKKAQTTQPSTTTLLRGQFFNHNCVLFGVVKVYQTFSICDPGPRSALRPHAPTSVLTSVIAGYYTHKWSLVQQCLSSITPTSGDLICHSGLYIGYPTIRPLSFRPRSFCPGHFVPCSFRTQSFRPLVISSPGHFVPSFYIIHFHSTCVKKSLNCECCH